MSTIAITGSAGLIGSHLCYRFLKDHKVVGIDNMIGGYASNMPDSSNFIHYNEDILNSFVIADIFKKHKPSLVIHCAALAHEGLSVFSPNTITNNIYSGTISIASAAISAGVSTFINTSSMARYGSIAVPFKESDTPNPIDPYGLAKLQAEQQLNLLSDIHGIKVFHLVPHNVSGPHQCYSDPFRNVMSIFANRILNHKNVYIYGDGEQKRSFSHIDDCVDAFISLYNKKDSLPNKNVFNIGPSHGTEITINELAYSVYKHFNREPDIKRIDARPREVLHAWVSTEKAEQLLNYKTNKTTQDVIADTVSWIRKSSNRQFNYHLPLEIVTEKTPKTWTDKLFND